MLNRRFTSTALFLALFLVGFSSLAVAQTQVGFRAGVSGDPSQAFVGGHIDLKEVRKNIWFRPSAELGIGDTRALVALDGDFVYFRNGKLRDWNPYVGGGPAAIVQAGRGKPEFGPGFDFIVGIQERKGLLIEVKIGAMDSPRFRAGIGWTW